MVETESVYSGTISLPTKDLDAYIVKGAAGDCSFTGSTIDDELASLIIPLSTGHIFISQHFLESRDNPVQMDKYRDEEEYEDDVERISCEFCGYQTQKFVKATLYEPKSFVTSEEEKVELACEDHPDRIEADALHVCVHCVTSLREEASEFRSGIETIIASEQI